MSAFVQRTPGSGSAGASTTATLNITFPSTTVTGNLFVVAFDYQAATGTVSLGSISDNKGNTYVIDHNIVDPINVNQRWGFAHIFNANGGASTMISIVINNSVSATIRYSAVIYEISGATVIDVDTNGSAGVGSNPPPINFTTVIPNSVAISNSTTDNNAATWVENNGWSQDITSNQTGQFCASNVLPSAGANSLNATATPAVDIQWLVMTFGTPAALPPSSYPLESNEYY